jgi:hypothetical protein
MNLINRIQGIFFNPQLTLKALSEKPVWVDALIIIMVTLIIFSYITIPYAQKDNLEAMKNNIELRERLGEERYNQRMEFLENPPKALRYFLSFIGTPAIYLIGFLISSLVILIMGRLTSTEGRFVQVFAAVLHANFIDKILGNAVRLLLILSRKSVMQTTTSLALLFPRMEVTSSTYLILSQVDFFQLWLFGILGYGLSHIFKIDLKKGLILSYAFWFLKSLLYVGTRFLQQGFGG